MMHGHHPGYTRHMYVRRRIEFGRATASGLGGCCIPFKSWQLSAATNNASAMTIVTVVLALQISTIVAEL